jgi:hypothetical protein
MGQLINAHEYLACQSPSQHFTITQIVAQGGLARETLFQQFGRKAGLRWAADARAAIRLPALWADLGFTEPCRSYGNLTLSCVRCSLEEPR